jgi:hypothetical protein
MGFGAYRRPDFGFDESLGFARRLVGLADTVTRQLTALTDERDSALAAWSGPWGEEFRLRARDEDTNHATVVDACGFEAEQWAKAWRDAATETNGVVYAEAVAEQRAYPEEQQREYEESRSGWQAFGDALYSGTVGHFTGGDEESFRDVEEPQPAALPVADGFSVSAPFVRYHRSGDQMVPGYGGTVPPESEYGMSEAEYQAWLDGQTQEGEDAAPPPPATTTELPEHPDPRGVEGFCNLRSFLKDLVTTVEA